MATALADLLSPEATRPTFELTLPNNRKNPHDSTASESFNDVNLDDDTFSPIALAHDTGTPPDASDEPSEDAEQPANGLSHVRSASTATLQNSVPFDPGLVENGEGDLRPHRTSLDGQHQLQDQFEARKQKDRAEHEDSEHIDWDFWGAVISDYQLFASEHPEELARAIARGIPGTLRGMMWQLMAASKDPELESTYLKLLKESSTHEKSITRDLGRTFPHHDYFNNGQGIGQENLFNVLKAYSLYDELVGYCQGLPFVVAILLLNMPDEEAFSLLVRLMHVYDLRGHFLPEMPKLQLRLFQFDRLVEELLPVLHIHFLRQGVKSSMFCSQWFLTMFSYRFPLEIVYRIYDNCLASGIEAIFGFSIMLLMKNEDILLSLKFDQILDFLNNRLFDRYMLEPDEEGKPQYMVDQFVQDAVSLSITPFMLDGYRHEYEDMVRENNKHAIEMDELRNSNRVLSSSVKSLETSLAQLNTEHVQVLVIDYKLTFASVTSSASETERLEAVSKCHSRSAERVLQALLANGGIFIKLGQHMGSLLVLPREWTSTMRPLQDKCDPTPYPDIEKLFESDMGATLSDLFDEFDPTPIGVASLAQVHVGRDRKTGQRVAVKIQHPHLAEFCDIDMAVVESSLGWIKFWFPEFEFTWLADEMKTNLPLEMNFVHEAANAEKTRQDFADVRSALYIPRVLSATSRVLVMEFIEGGRVDDLAYLKAQRIDRNQVALEIAAIFNRMVLINGWFHADPHPGNLLIRRSPINSMSTHNFEIVLLDHGQYFDLDPELRINYSKLWLSLIAPATPTTRAERRKYAEAVGNISPEQYAVFEAALTGRASLEGSWDGPTNANETFQRGSGLMDIQPQSEAEKEAIRDAVMSQEGILTSVLDILRKVPRRMLMILKLNDLTRSLDHALMTTHSNIRIFLVSAKYCTTAVWQDDRRRLIREMHESGFVTLSILVQYLRCWWKYQKMYSHMSFVEYVLDMQALLVKVKAWSRGLLTKGLRGASDAAAGLA
ncbi:ABC1-domain-containing protein [Mycena chlorophos]|uniref:ABC1-domain-containing protein n=1 Tax=Mycena chlorophos TaxID=658473 RepID=A0A8H6RZT3_MYCCL|nr:ABC1-domain-containing protein [Mycena chlorophos]